MKQHTTEEIKKFVKTLWPKIDGSRIVNEPNLVKVTVWAMYSHPELSFRILKEFSKFFETDSINDDDRYSRAGCPTCDTGSEYGFTITIRDESPVTAVKTRSKKNRS